jgi:EAL domain-containing protein (putative c-di-GMP-specific phosphodiesterase class I)
VTGHDIFVTASIGIALSTLTHEQPEQFLRDADTAMYQAKSQGRAKYVIFNSEMHSRAVERLQQETDIRKAIERQEFVIYYQPILSLENKLLVGFEALVRWQHPTRGLVYPGDFIPLADETGLILYIDQIVLREACAQMHKWKTQFPDTALSFMNVNLSNRQLAQPDLFDFVCRTLEETGLDPKSLLIEITESVVITHQESMAAVLNRLKALGVHIYIDDFGTGYSSLSYLHNLPIDGLKIDRSFIQKIGDKGEGMEIIKTILMLARDINVAVIAEGLETAKQVSQISSLQCKYGQGYFFSKAVESGEAESFIVKSHIESRNR